MKRVSTSFLKIVLFLIALGVLTGLLWFPQTEGRAKNLDLLSIYANPFIIYIYIASIPLFSALLQAFRLLGYIENNKVFTQQAVQSLRNIKIASLAIIGFMLGALVYIRIVLNGDDPAGPTMIGLIVIFASIVIATAAGIFQKLLQNAVDMKSENDLTV